MYVCMYVCISKLWIPNVLLNWNLWGQVVHFKMHDLLWCSHLHYFGCGFISPTKLWISKCMSFINACGCQVKNFKGASVSGVVLMFLFVMLLQIIWLVGQTPYLCAVEYFLWCLVIDYCTFTSSLMYMCLWCGSHMVFCWQMQVVKCIHEPLGVWLQLYVGCFF